MAFIGDSTSIWWLHAAAVGLQSADSAESASNYCPLLQTIYQFFFVLSGSTVLYNGWILYMSVFNEKRKWRRQTKAVAEPKISPSLNCG